MAEIVVLNILTKSQRKNKINIKGAACLKLCCYRNIAFFFLPSLKQL